MQKRDPRKKKYWCPLEFGARTWGAKSQRSPVFSAEGPRHLLGARAGGEKQAFREQSTDAHSLPRDGASVLAAASSGRARVPVTNVPHRKPSWTRPRLGPRSVCLLSGAAGFVRGGPLSWPAGSWKAPQCLPVAALGHLLFPVASSPPALCLLRFLSRTPRVPLARPPSPSSALAHGLVFLGW